jgi:hypothetical protein
MKGQIEAFGFEPSQARCTWALRQALCAHMKGQETHKIFMIKE